MTRETAHGDVRVLDRAGTPDEYYTKLLVDLGADVIKVEKPGAWLENTERIRPGIINFEEVSS